MTQTAPQPVVAPSGARETAARLRHLRTSPPKVRMVLKLITGQDIDTARDTLLLCDRGVARDVGKLLDSAVANAQHNDQMPEDELYVARAFADEGPQLKRWRPRARGRGVRVRKRTSHVTIVVARFGDEELERRRAREATGPVRRRPTRRRAAPVEDHDHEDHDHEHEHEHDEDEDDTAERAPAKKATKRPAKKTTKKAAPAKKAAKGTKKATKKAAPAKKATKKKDD